MAVYLTAMNGMTYFTDIIISEVFAIYFFILYQSIHPINLFFVFTEIVCIYLKGF